MFEVFQDNKPANDIEFSGLKKFGLKGYETNSFYTFEEAKIYVEFWLGYFINIVVNIPYRTSGRIIEIRETSNSPKVKDGYCSKCNHEVKERELFLSKYIGCMC